MLTTNIKYRCIGKGFCGSVWALEDSQTAALTVVKREDGGPGRSVSNDYNMHLRVLQSATQHHLSTPLLVPQCHRLVEPTDPWWQICLPQFPAGYSACRGIVSERIPKVPRSISNSLVDLFCADNASLASFVKSNADDDCCLVRPYLGRRRRRRQGGASTSRFQRFSLRNVPLHVDQMEALGLDIKTYARSMADALGLMHWGAQIDANDVEYVLAPPRLPPALHSSPAPFESDHLGTHSMWILDFDCCRPLSMDDAGVEKACSAFFKNDPFYPRPGGEETADRELWTAFKQRFLDTSADILKKRNLGDPLLAEKLMERIEEEGLQRNLEKKKKKKKKLG